MCFRIRWVHGRTIKQENPVAPLSAHLAHQRPETPDFGDNIHTHLIVKKSPGTAEKSGERPSNTRELFASLFAMDSYSF